ncbi:MAG: outer membrane beta-barrel protein [Melioribacteraceae bacterium]|nr:outer membrane beta-barrel protein [Melioribacteraceae bacterium]
MKKIFQSLIILLLLVSISKAQSLRIGPAVGFTAVQESGIFGPSMPDLDNNLHYGVKAKLSLPMLPLKIQAHVIYTSFEGSGNAIPPIFSSLTKTDVKVETSLLSIGIGGEWALIPGPVQPYIAADFLISSFGDTDISYSNIYDVSTSGESRYGLGIGAGVDFKLLPTIDVDLTLKYNFNNLIGKEDWEDNFNTINLTANILFGIL